MLVTIIIPALNEEESIASTIRALQSLDGPKEIIVVDGGSADQTIEIARSCGVQVLQAPPGRGRQMRAGATIAQGDILWFVHADTLAPACALASIRAALVDSSVVGGNLGVIFDGSSRAARRMTAIYPWLRALGLCYGDSGIFVRREAYQQIGGFRPVALFEDLDFLRRLRGAGRFLHLEPCMVTSSRRFEQRNFASMWAQWTALQVLYWCGVPPDTLARYYRHARKPRKPDRIAER